MIEGSGVGCAEGWKEGCGVGAERQVRETSKVPESPES